MTEQHDRIKQVHQQVYTDAQLTIKDFIPQEEGAEYCAHTFSINSHNALFRVAKKTPKKVGWFVAIWKRGADGITCPHDAEDIDFLVITVEQSGRIGQFIFPKQALITHKIVSVNGAGGKRGMRVYAPFDVVSSSQAARTQQWQKAYFVDLAAEQSVVKEQLRRIWDS